jgi:hypothetical protein
MILPESCTLSPAIVIAVLALIALIAFLFNELFRKSALIAWIAFLVLPIALLPFWLGKNPTLDLFFFVKAYSVFVSIWLVLYFRRPNQHHPKWIFYLFFSLFIVNIFEATLRGLISFKAEDMINSAAGILLMFTVPHDRTGMTFSQGNRKGIFWDVPTGWILGYTLWNLTFMQLTFPYSMGRAASALAAPLLTAFFIDRKLWVEARVMTLGLMLIFGLSFPEPSYVLNAPCSAHPLIEMVLPYLSVAWMIIYAIGLWKKRT